MYLFVWLIKQLVVKLRIQHWVMLLLQKKSILVTFQVRSTIHTLFIMLLLMELRLVSISLSRTIEIWTLVVLITRQSKSMTTFHLLTKVKRNRTLKLLYHQLRWIKQLTIKWLIQLHQLMMQTVHLQIQQLKATNQLVMKQNLLHILKQVSKVKTILHQILVHLMVMFCINRLILQLCLVN